MSEFADHDEQVSKRAGAAGADEAIPHPGAPGKMRLRGGPLRLETITKLRWGAVIGQSVAVIVAGFEFGFSAPLILCFVLISAAAWLNIFLASRYERTSRLEENQAFALFAFDTLQLGGLLFLTGGLINPFAIMIMAPVVTSSATLSLRRTAELGALAVALVTFLAFAHLPLPWQEGQPLRMPATYVAGIWTALTISILFITFYVFRVAGEAEALSEALTATEMVLQRELHIQQLDGLAAAAAHELGTPLATISLVAKELDRETSDSDSRKQDIELIREQALRCREILQTLSRNGADGEDHFPSVTPQTILQEIVEPLRDSDPDVQLDVQMLGDLADMPRSRRNAGALYGIGNIVENALDFARSNVTIGADWNADQVTITVRDDGPGFSVDSLERIGEPYMSRRRAGLETDRAGGLGLGLFIAKTLLERNGARLDASNYSAAIEDVEPKGNHSVNRLRQVRSGVSGAQVQITWDRAQFENFDGNAAWQSIGNSGAENDQ